MSFIETAYATQNGGFFDLVFFPTAKDYSDKEIFRDNSQGNVISSTECATILNYQVSLSILRRATETEVNEVFDRINTYGHRLSDQERRQAGVQNKFADLVRNLACVVRGDLTKSKLFLHEMPSISIDLPKTKHGYEVRADEVFWVIQGVLLSTDLRDSEDEQCIADIIACLIGQDLIARSKAALDAIYDVNSGEYTRIETSLDLYGSERITDEFKYCLGEIEKLCAEGGFTKLRELLFQARTTNAFPSVFVVIFIAIFECGVRRNRKISDYAGIKNALRGINTRIQAGQKGSSGKERRTNIDAVKGVIDKFFVVDPDIKAKIYSNHKIVDIENEIRSSEIELPNYELKQGILPLVKGNTNAISMLEKLLRTICAIANNGKTSSGKIIIGVADTDADAERATEIDGVNGKRIGKRTVVGVNREAKRMGITTEAYAELIVNHIKQSNLSEHTKSAILSHLDYNSYYDLGVLILSIPPQNEITYLGDEIYRRNGSSNELVTGAKDIVEMSKRFL